MLNVVQTIDFGLVPIRVNFTSGEEMAWILLSDGDYASIRKDPVTNQPFAVIFKEEE